MAKINLRVFNSGALCKVPIETLITLFTIKYCDSSVEIFLVKHSRAEDENSYVVDLSTFCYQFIEQNELSEISRGCVLPNLEENSKTCIAGLCGTLRQIIKNVLSNNTEHNYRYLLGFKESCLQACSEASVWTKFCEVDIVAMLSSANKQTGSETLPIALARFECHMSQPVRLHNVYKYSMSKKSCKTDADEKKVLPEHTYAEGVTVTLADIIIFVCIHVYFSFLDKNQLLNIIPLTIKWYDTMMSKEDILKCLDVLIIENLCSSKVIMNYILPAAENCSLYKSDPERYKPKNRIYTNQKEIESSVQKLENVGLCMSLDELFEPNETFSWLNIPVDATPRGGSLPNKRLQRKFDQLESLCKPILKLAKKGNTIVDFCSGGGHLGILLAYLLPDCRIVLLENKPQSMQKAKERVEKLSLTNVIFYQSNLDYFKGPFDIGTCLHACGVATDLVLQQCIKRNATFVCCPCCYGSVQDCPRITYPRSKTLKSILDKHSYFVVGHAADQTHDVHNAKTKQGYACMMIIDTDRRMHAEEHGYRVYLNKLIPETCSPKNHLLIGYKM